MSKVAPKFSRNKVDLAGKLLIKKNINKKETQEALNILNNRRASHDYPMNTFQANIRGKIKKFRFSAVVVERLKRIHSILGKLHRNPKMMLSRMQDIGGMRVVLTKNEHVYKLRDALISDKTRHQLVKEYDYIENPKQSGYMGIHLRYKYKNYYAPEYDGLKIEIQIRTQTQHTRATAVETVGLVLNCSLKSGEGPKARLDFFSICSSLFAIKEGNDPLFRHKILGERELKNKLRIMEKKLDVINKMTAYHIAIEHINTELYRKSIHHEYFLLILDNKQRKVEIIGFKKGELEKASKLYLKFEKKFTDESDGQVVLVFGESLKELKRAYPNYFGDSKKFISMLRVIIK